MLQFVRHLPLEADAVQQFPLKLLRAALVSVAAGVVEKRQSYGQLHRMNCWYAV